MFCIFEILTTLSFYVENNVVKANTIPYLLAVGEKSSLGRGAR